ncbi:MAG: hypothetical protein IJV13_01030 [Prevotella sp.]|nr:hypothetical protein [Prevotella sp.]
MDEELRSLVKQLLEEQKKTNAQLEETKKELEKANKKIDRLEQIIQSHDDYTRGIQCSDEEKIKHTTQVFLRWLDMHHKSKWERGVLRCVRSIEGGFIVIRHRCMTKFVKLLYSCMANSMSNQTKDIKTQIVNYCKQSDGNAVKDIGDIHTILSRAS